jgi:large subunit ribosomal protein L10
MPTAAKAKIIDETKALCERSSGLIFTEYRGLTVRSLQLLRKQLKESGTEYHVVKNTLFRRAYSEQVDNIPIEMTSGPTAIAFFEGDESAVAKSLADFQKQHPELVFKGGYIAGQVLDENQIKVLSKLPTKPELISQLLSIVEAPVRNIAGILNESLAQVVRVIGAIEEQKAGAA